MPAQQSINPSVAHYPPTQIRHRPLNLKAGIRFALASLLIFRSEYFRRLAASAVFTCLTLAIKFNSPFHARCLPLWEVERLLTNYPPLLNFVASQHRYI
jgi:hypothetical protein